MAFKRLPNAPNPMGQDPNNADPCAQIPILLADLVEELVKTHPKVFSFEDAVKVIAERFPDHPMIRTAIAEDFARVQAEKEAARAAKEEDPLAVMERMSETALRIAKTESKAQQEAKGVVEKFKNLYKNVKKATDAKIKEFDNARIKFFKEATAEGNRLIQSLEGMQGKIDDLVDRMMTGEYERAIKSGKEFATPEEAAQYKELSDIRQLFGYEKDIAKLQGEIARMEKGDYSQTPKTVPPEEWGKLAQMRARRDDLKRQAQEMRQRYKQSLEPVEEPAPDVVKMTDEQRIEKRYAQAIEDTIEEVYGRGKTKEGARTPDTEETAKLKQEMKDWSEVLRLKKAVERMKALEAGAVPDKTPNQPPRVKYAAEMFPADLKRGLTQEIEDIKASIKKRVQAKQEAAKEARSAERTQERLEKMTARKNELMDQILTRQFPAKVAKEGKAQTPEQAELRQLSKIANMLKKQAVYQKALETGKLDDATKQALEVDYNGKPTWDRWQELVKEQNKQLSADMREMFQEQRLQASLDGLLKRLETRDYAVEPTAKREVTEKVKALKLEITKANKKLRLYSDLAQLKVDLAGDPKALLDKFTARKEERKSKAMAAIDDEILKLQVMKRRAQNEAYIRMEEARPRSVWEKIVDGMFDSFRTGMTMADMSFLTRQGDIGMATLMLTKKGRKQISETITDTFKNFRTEEGAIREWMKIEERKNFDLYMEYGKFFDSTSGMIGGSRNEEFRGNVIKSLSKVPGFRSGLTNKFAKVVEGIAGMSERSFGIYMNKLRADMFDGLLEQLGDNPTKAELEDIGRAVRIATGKVATQGTGTWDKVVNMLFFAPRWRASRWGWATGAPIWMADGGFKGILKGGTRSQRAIGKMYARHMAGKLAQASVIAIAGALLAGKSPDEIFELDPRSSQFMKLKMGNGTYVDWSGGVTDPIDITTRLLMGQRKTLGGEIVDTRGEDVPFGGQSGAEIIGNYARTGLAPVPGMAVDFLTGKNVVGKPIPEGVAGKAAYVAGRGVPLSVSSAKEAFTNEELDVALAAAMFDFLGSASMTVPPKEPKAEKKSSTTSYKNPYL